METDRRSLLKLIGTGAVAAASSSLGGCRAVEGPEVEMDESKGAAKRMPVLFLGHGSPMNAIRDTEWSRAFRALAQDLPRPKAVLAVSAHWWADGTYLTGEAKPRTIHDFGGFPQELFEVQYPAPGSPDLAARVAAILAERSDPPASVQMGWGLDHGTWSVLRHVIPEADVPVVQLSLDSRLSGAQHHELGRALRELRGEGVLVLGSGNITHNLREAAMRQRGGEADVPDWSTEFDRDVAAAIRERDTDHLVKAWPDGKHARRAHPYPDHWYPLLYAYAASDDADAVSFPVTGFAGALSMRAVRWG